MSLSRIINESDNGKYYVLVMVLFVSKLAQLLKMTL